MTWRTRNSFTIARLSCRSWYRAAFDQPVAYELTGEEGPDHDKTFHVEVHIGADDLRRRERKDQEGSRAGGGLQDDPDPAQKEYKVGVTCI